jgi:hypothetical protein
MGECTPSPKTTLKNRLYELLFTLFTTDCSFSCFEIDSSIPPEKNQAFRTIVKSDSKNEEILKLFRLRRFKGGANLQERGSGPTQE